jgi:hypothetical protein
VDSWHLVPSSWDDDPDTVAEQVTDNADTVIEPASWIWHLDVERVGENCVEAEQPWSMGRTEVDPRTIEYGVFGGTGAPAYVQVLQNVVARASDRSSPRQQPETRLP